MQRHRRDPYLWLNFAGLATVPLWLDICLAGLAVSDPMVPPWLELVALVMVGTAPILWMQVQRPFYIFSVPGLALRPDQLNEDRRRLLTLQRGWLSQSLALLTAIALFLALYWLYQLAPIAADLPWLMGKSRATGWEICAIAFFLANFFALVPATTALLLLTPPRRLDATPPLDAPQILTNFTVLGLRIDRILPDFTDSDITDEAADNVPAAADDVLAKPTATDTDAVKLDSAPTDVESATVGQKDISEADNPDDLIASTAVASDDSPETVVAEDVPSKATTSEKVHTDLAVGHASTLPDADLPEIPPQEIAVAPTGPADAVSDPTADPEDSNKEPDSPIPVSPTLSHADSETENALVAEHRDNPSSMASNSHDSPSNAVAAVPDWEADETEPPISDSSTEATLASVQEATADNMMPADDQ
ncbi:MAG: low-complexity tail membrane protein [Cyanobacteria bacterium P01_C01_bin.70]